MSSEVWHHYSRIAKGYTHCNVKSPDLTNIYFWKIFVSLDVIFIVHQIKEIQMKKLMILALLIVS